MDSLRNAKSPHCEMSMSIMEGAYMYCSLCGGASFARVTRPFQTPGAINLPLVNGLSTQF